MQLLVSQLPKLGIFAPQLCQLPSRIGIELLYETGNDLFWKYNLPKLTEGRVGPLSVHGPFSWIDLSAPDAPWQDILENYKRCFAFCAEYHAVHCVCHPDAPHPGRDPAQRREELALAIDRLLRLQDEAQKFGVLMLVENLPEEGSLFLQEVFTQTLSSYKELSFLLDTGHAIISGWDMEQYLSVMGQRVKGVHVHEPRDGRDAHFPVGSGGYDWTAFFAACQRYIPEANIVLEYESASISQILESISYIESMIQ